MRCEITVSELLRHQRDWLPLLALLVAITLGFGTPDFANAQRMPFSGSMHADRNYLALNNIQRGTMGPTVNGQPIMALPDQSAVMLDQYIESWDPQNQNPCCCHAPTCLSFFEFSGGYLLMAREYYRNTPIFTGTINGETRLSMGDFEGHYDSGFEVRGRLSRLEVRYFQLSNDTQATAFASVTNFPTNLGTYQGIPFFGIPAMFNYDTDLYNGEINLLLCDSCSPVRLSGGFRYMRLNEQLNVRTQDNPDLSFTQTKSDLYGLQIGGDVNVPFTQNWPISLVCFTKAGLFYSDTRMNNVVAPGPMQISQTDDSQRLAFVGELGLKAQAHLGPLTLDAGYQCLFINGVALAGDQPQGINLFALPAPTASMRTGDLLYHGLTTSATLRW